MTFPRSPLSLALLVASCICCSENADESAATAGSTQDDTRVEVADAAVSQEDSLALETPDGTPRAGDSAARAPADADAARDTTDSAEDTTPPPSDSASAALCPVPSGLQCAPSQAAVEPVSSAAPVTVFDGHFLCSTTGGTPSACEDYCSLGECVPAGDFGAYTADHVEYVVELALSAPGCCFDVDGDGDIDNAFGNGLDLGAALRGGAADIDVTVSTVVESGRLVIAMTRQTTGPNTILGLLPSSPDGDVSVFKYPPIPPVLMFPRESAFVPGTQTPLSRVSIVAEGADWVSTGDQLGFSLPIGRKILLPVLIRGLRLRITPSETGSLVSVGGYLLYAEFLSTINDLFASGGDCECLGVEGPLVGLSYTAPDRMEAAAGAALAAGDCGQESFCAEFAIVAATGLLGAALAPDLDLSGDGINDALSIGIQLRTLPGDLWPPDE